MKQCDTTVMNICHYTFIKTHGTHNAKSEPNVYYGLREVMKCQSGYQLEQADHCDSECPQWGRLRVQGVGRGYIGTKYLLFILL